MSTDDIRFDWLRNRKTINPIKVLEKAKSSVIVSSCLRSLLKIIDVSKALELLEGKVKEIVKPKRQRRKRKKEKSHMDLI